MGWWSDVLPTDQALGQARDRRLLQPLEGKREKFAAKYGCKAAASYEEILGDSNIRSNHQHHAERGAPRDHARRGQGGQPTFLDKPIANTIARRRAPSAKPAARPSGSRLGYQRRRESHFRWIKEHLGSFGKLRHGRGQHQRDRLGQIDLSSWRLHAEGMPAG